MSEKDKKQKQNQEDETLDVISLEDLAPLDDVSGGSGSVLFGQRSGQDEPAPKRRTRKRKK